MDYTKVLKQAWHTVWNYRALWIFGIILALTTTSWSGWEWLQRSDDSDGNHEANSLVYVLPNGSTIEIPGREDAWGDDGGDVVFNYKHQADDRPYHKGDIIINYNPPDDYSVGVVSRSKEGHLHLELLEARPEVVSTIIPIGIALACLIVLLIIAAAIARYLAETALIRMVDDYDETGQKHSIREGFRMGWSRTAFRLFLIKLLIGLPVAVAFILLFVLAAAPLLLWTTKSTAIGVFGTMTTVGLGFLVTLLLIVVITVLSLLRRFFWRACAVEELGVIESIRQGFGIVRRHLKDVVIMWLIMVAVQIGWVIALIATAIVLFPAIILLIIVGGVLGGLPALLVGGLASLILEGAVPWILAGVVGVPIFILVMAAPWIFLGGLMEVFKSSVWTLSYRELRALEPARLPELDASGLEAALLRHG
ncbi:MAG: hypothetical protein GTN71_15305 [Anaerolineae bacterium]|nr:hypothetical protein [Anaerolineae bacterium]